mgnify:FL=1
MTTRLLARPIGYSYLGTSPNKFRYWTVNCISTFLLYIQLLKENATFKLHFVLIVLPCKQQNVTSNRFLNYMHLPLRERRRIKKHTQLINIPNNKNFDPQLRTIADYVAFYSIASLLYTCLLHTFC